ncbi:MAG: c-type cytochrome [Bryobacteraceae bacterium]
MPQRFAIFLLPLCLTLAQETNPHTSPGDIEQGRRLFDARCAGCHGKNGSGGRGTNLAQPDLPRSADDASLFRVIQRGIPGTEMPNQGLATNREIWQMAAYVRSLGRLPQEPVTGDAARGQVIFNGKGNCRQCHTAGLEGGRMGPVLNGSGARRGVAYLRQTLLDPQSRVPFEFGFYEVALRGGRRIRGIRINEDTQSIQLRDLSDKLHSYWKDELSEIKRLDGQTPMPSYKGVLSDTEVNDVVAYLVSLKEVR